jgi:glycosyltransferase involved in cell wall biosynthesis
VSRIGYVTTVFPSMTMFVEAEVGGLIRRGHQVTVFALRPPPARRQPEHEWLMPHVRYVGSPLAPASWAAGLRQLLRRPAAAADAARLLSASLGDPYALAGHLGYLPAACAVAQAARREGIERLHGAWAHFPASVAYLAARWSGARFSLSAHAGADLYRSQAFLGAKVDAADFVATCVRGNVDTLLRLAPRAAGHVHCIYHGVNLARFDGSGRTLDPRPFFLSVGGLRAPKGFHVAVEAVARLREQGVRARYAIVGEGAQRPELEALVARLGLQEDVELLGERAQPELLPLYRRAWALLHPSIVMPNGRRDGIPNVVIEAMAMGVPCVGTRAAGLEEVIEEGVTGFLAAPGDARSLVEAIHRVVDDPEGAEARGREAAARVRREFDVARNFERLAALFERDFSPPAASARLAEAM